MTHTVLAQFHTGDLTEKAKTNFFGKLSKALDLAKYISEGPSETTTQEVQETRRAEGSSSTHPLDMDSSGDVKDGDRSNSTTPAESYLNRATIYISMPVSYIYSTKLNSVACS